MHITFNLSLIYPIDALFDRHPHTIYSQKATHTHPAYTLAHICMRLKHQSFEIWQTFLFEWYAIFYCDNKGFSFRLLEAQCRINLLCDTKIISIYYIIMLFMQWNGIRKQASNQGAIGLGKISPNCPDGRNFLERCFLPPCL